MKDLKGIAVNNLQWLIQHQYSGRGLIQGITQDLSHLIQIYWVTSRSEDNRNRRLKEESGGMVRTVLANPSKTKADTSLTLYDAMLERNGEYYVSNGDHTESALIGSTRTQLSIGLAGRTHEPDEPNCTIRIIGRICRKGPLPLMEIGMLRPSGGCEPTKAGPCRREFYQDEWIPPGYGYGVTTYERDGKPLPPFEGKPRLFPLPGAGLEEIAQYYWTILDNPHRVALVVKAIPAAAGRSQIITRNQYDAVELVEGATIA